MKTRFAPSPTGYLHLGHALAAKEAFGFGAQNCLLRIEDIDHTRCKPEFTQAIYDDLRWLGFNWPEPVRVQSEHLSDYAKVIEQLRERGLIYRCFKTRSQLTAAPPAPLSATLENQNLMDGKAYAWRLSIAAAIKTRSTTPLTYIDTGETKTVNLGALEDIVLARKDIGTSYHIAVTHDDALQGITHVVRGADFTEQTAYHVLLQELMGWPRPIYHHHGLMMGDNGKKLSKRSFAASIASMRDSGASAQNILTKASL